MIKTTLSVFLVASLACFSMACSDTASDAIPWDLGDDAKGADVGHDDAGLNSDDSGSCNPLDDACPEGEYCQYQNGELRCVTEGSVKADNTHTAPECPEQVCSRGGMCMPSREGLVAQYSCYQPCDVAEVGQNSDCWNGRHTCYQAYGDDESALSFGLCAY